MIAALIFSLSSGVEEIGLMQLLNTFSDSDISPDQTNIIYNFRLPKSLAALFCGSSLAVCGLLMQTLFRNPLAGPYVLGINSGANLFVSVFLMGTTSIEIIGLSDIKQFGLPVFSMLGSFTALLFILLISKRIKNSTTILLTGIMLGFFYSALQGLIEYFSNPVELKNFTVWSMGNFSSISWSELQIFIPVSVLGICVSFFLVKALNNYLLGNNYAKSSGTNIIRTRWLIITITGFLSGITVAYCGPVAFVGLIVPHISRMIFKTSNHAVLIPASALCGGILLLLCDSLGSFFSRDFTLPINIITSLVGAPFVIWIMLNKTNQYR